MHYKFLTDEDNTKVLKIEKALKPDSMPIYLQPNHTNAALKVMLLTRSNKLNKAAL